MSEHPNPFYRATENVAAIVADVGWLTMLEGVAQALFNSGRIGDAQRVLRLIGQVNCTR